MGTLANSECPDEMQYHAAFHQGLHCLLNYATFHLGLHCLLRSKQPSGTEIHYNLETLKYKMGKPILIVSICRTSAKSV